MLSSGTRFGSYEVLSPLGAGGMGEVFRARDLKLGREVALKVLPQNVSAEPERIARFQREAQVLASLNHPHIAAIYGLEEVDGVRALVLELVEGETLADRIARGPMAVDEALPIARQIAEALETAHDQGIVHRDLKPANIKVDPDGRVKVLDFGLAKLTEQPAATTNSSALSMSPTITTPAMTQLGMILGTAAYMAPEQAKGRPADKRSDVWAFGCLLYEMLTGARAFEGEDVSDTLAAVLRGDPDWTRLPATVPDAVKELLSGSLRKDRHARIGDISVAKFLLERPASVSVIPKKAGRVSWRSVAIASVAAALVAAAAAGFAVYQLRPAAEPAIVKLPLPLPDGVVFTSVATRGLDISLDGRQLVYIIGGRVTVRSLDQWEPKVIDGTGDGVVSPIFAPDGKSVAYYSTPDQALKRIPIAGGAPIVLGGLMEVPYGLWWSDKWLWVGQGERGIIRLPENGGGRFEQVVEAEPGQQMSAPSVLPGGEWLLFALAKTGRPQVWDSADIVVQSLQTKERKVVIPGGNNPRYVPSGHLIYAVEGTLFADRFDVRTLTAARTPIPVVTGVRRGTATAAAQFSVSDNGTLVYTPGPARLNSAATALMLGSFTEAPKALPMNPGPYLYPRVTSDGKRVAFVREESGASDIWTYDLTKDNPPSRVTFDGRTRHPVWTRDGSAIAVQSEQDKKAGIFLQSLDGSRRRVTTAADGEVHLPESISKDGWLLFSVLKNNTYTLMMIRLDGSEMKPFGDVRSVNQTDAVFSPDDRWVAYAYTERAGGQVTPDRGVYVEPFPPTGAKLQVPKTGLDYHPAWATDGKTLYYLPGANRVMMSVPFDTATGVRGKPVEVRGIGRTGHLGNDRRHYDVLPDGRFLLVLDPQTAGVSPATSFQFVFNWFEELKRTVGTN